MRVPANYASGAMLAFNPCTHLTSVLSEALRLMSHPLCRSRTGRAYQGTVVGREGEQIGL